jgi:hypothetical protein
MHSPTHGVLPFAIIGLANKNITRTMSSRLPRSVLQKIAFDPELRAAAHTNPVAYLLVPFRYRLGPRIHRSRMEGAP